MPSYAGPPVAARPGEIASALALLAYLALAITLMVMDLRGGWLSQVRNQANVAVQPIWWLAGLPGRLSTRVQDDAATRIRLTDENRELRNQLLIANARLTRLHSASTDNAQLRVLLGMTESHGLDVQLAPILNIDLDPTRQRLVLDAGSRDGVKQGQVVIDAGGLMGQIIETTPLHSTVLLVTDPDHAVPVVVARNGVRLVAYGRGGSLQVPDIPLNADIKVDDVIITSGLGGVFPAGFPVGIVAQLHSDDSHAFLVADVKPAAQLDRGRDVLLLHSAPTRLPTSDASTNAVTEEVPQEDVVALGSSAITVSDPTPVSPALNATINSAPANNSSAAKPPVNVPAQVARPPQSPPTAAPVQR